MKKQIKILSLRIINFKGIENLQISFYDKTSIEGKNGRGKTSIKDALLWLWFGKNSEDKKDFSIKNTKKPELNKLDHEVESVLLIDGIETTLRKVFREKWTTKRGSSIEEYTGNETEYFVNNVPKKAGEFSDFISSIVDERVFKIITNPLYFNSASVKWEERRSILGEMASLASSDAEWLNQFNQPKDFLVQVLSERKTFEDSKKQLAASRKLLNDEKDSLPIRIDELARQAPIGEDFAALSNSIVDSKAKSEELKKELDSLYSASTQARDKIMQSQAEFSRWKTRLAELQSAKPVNPNQANIDLLNSELDNNSKIATKLQQEIGSLTNNIEYTKNLVKEQQVRLAEYQKKKEDKLKIYEEENAKEFKVTGDFVCSQCQRKYEGDLLTATIEKAKTNFNLSKAELIKSIVNEGSHLANLIQNTENIIKGYEAEIEKNDKAKAEKAALLLATNKLIQESQAKLKSLSESEAKLERVITAEEVELEAKIAAYKPEELNLPERVEEIKKELEGLFEQQKELERRYSVKSQIEQIAQRKAELNKRQQSVAEELASIDGRLSQLESFATFKAMEIERKVNSIFEGTPVSFRMFDKQINGGLDPTCQALINGVPFQDANYGAGGMVEGGIHIINKLCDFYGVSAPILIDNAESVNRFPYTESQLVSLVVLPEYSQEEGLSVREF